MSAPADDGTLWTWRADDGCGRAEGGVTDMRTTAICDMVDALRGMPDGVEGTMRPCWLDHLACGSSYRYGAPVLVARRVPGAAAIAFSEYRDNAEAAAETWGVRCG